MTALPISEADWLTRVIDIPLLNGWLVNHQRPARTERGWRTATQGRAGFPDLVLARNGEVIVAELKANAGQLRPEQKEWLRHLGPYGCVWRPRDSDQVLQRLTRRGVG
jgi:hypothetical protein